MAEPKQSYIVNSNNRDNIPAMGSTCGSCGQKCRLYNLFGCFVKFYFNNSNNSENIESCKNLNANHAGIDPEEFFICRCVEMENLSRYIRLK